MATKSIRSAGTQITQRGPTQGNILVDPVTGLPINVVEDADGKKRLCVDAALSVSSAVVEVDLDASTDSVRIEDPDTGAHIRVNPDGSINTSLAVDAADGDNIAISAHPEQIFDSGESTISDGSLVNIYNYTSTDNRTRISKIESIVSTPALVEIRINTQVIKRKWTSSLERNMELIFEEHLPLSSGDILRVYAQVERNILGNYKTFTSIEGYLN